VASDTTHKRRLLHPIQRALDRMGVPPQGAAIAVAVSGGPDSAALLRLLHALAPSHPHRLVVAHLNHGLRGTEADEDEAFVIRLAGELGLPFESLRIDLKTIHAERGGNLQDLARKYDTNSCSIRPENTHTPWIALGHNRDDQAETILLSLIRGTGKTGLSGMPETRALDSEHRLIRPLLEIGRDEIIQFLKQRQAAWREDSSNAAPYYSRNRLRRDILPVLKELNPQIAETLSGMGRVLAEEDRYLNRLARKALNTLGEPALDGARLPGWNMFWSARYDRFLEQPPALLRRMLRLLLRRGFTRRNPPLARPVEDILEALGKDEPQWDLRLSENLYFGRRYEILFLGKERVAPEAQPILLPDAGEIPIPALNGILKIERIPRPANLTPLLQSREARSGHAAFLDAGTIRGPLTLRPRRPGERFTPLGMKGSRKVKKTMMEAELTREQRLEPRIVACGDAVVWIVGAAIAHPYRITDETKEIVWMRFEG
jgi:tRNA(Ile)-lysidine synthase